MNTQLLINQLTVAILSSAIAIPAIQRAKMWLPSQKFVEPLSVFLSFVVGFGVAIYYAEFAVIESLIVGFFSVVGAESIYKAIGSKMKSYQVKIPNIVDFEGEIEETEGQG